MIAEGNGAAGRAVLPTLAATLALLRGEEAREGARSGARSREILGQVDLVRETDHVRARLDEATLAALCAGHFPGDPVVPGAHLLGCMADLAGWIDAAAVVVERCVFRALVRPQAGVWAQARAERGKVVAEIVIDGEARPAAVAWLVRR
jgi:hypothetical protein